MTSTITWRAEGGDGLEGTRLLLGSGGFRAIGRMIRSNADGEFTASYRLVVGEDGAVARLSVTSATAERERHLTVNRTEDGFWLLDTGTGGSRAEFGGAVDIDLAYSPMFNTLPIRRLGLHRKVGERELPTLFVSLPVLEVSLVTQHYRTVSTLDGDGTAVVAFHWDDFAADIVVDADGVVQSYPGVATRLPVRSVASPTG